MGKGENSGYQHFLLFPRCFQKVFISGGASKVVIVLLRVCTKFSLSFRFAASLKTFYFTFNDIDEYVIYFCFPSLSSNPLLFTPSLRSSVRRVADFSTRGRCFDSPARPIFFPRTDDSHCDRIHSSLTAVHCFNNCYVGEQPLAWKKYCAGYR